MKKDLKYLNSKWWYRLIKVLYVLIFVFASFYLVAINVVSYEPTFNSAKSSIICKNGKPIEDVYMYSPYSWSLDYTDIKFECASDEELGAATKSSFPEYKEIENSALGKSIREKYKGNAYANLIQINMPTNYNTNLVYFPRNWFATIGFSVLIVAGVFLFLEILKRIFYYVYLGKLFPKKIENNESN